jgi:hypothetical protein
VAHASDAAGGRDLEVELDRGMKCRKAEGVEVDLQIRGSALPKLATSKNN